MVDTPIGTIIDGTVLPINAQPFTQNPPFRTNDEMLQYAINTMRTVCPDLTDFSSGSPALALAQLKVQGDQWLQWLINVVFLNSRLFTATGPGVDTYCADFGLYRTKATYATGYVTFGRYTATNQVIIPLNAIVQTNDGTQRFVILPDPSNPLYDLNNSRYVLPIDTLQGNILVQAINEGTQGNVAAGTITRQFSSVAGISFVNNSSAFTNGVEGETDTHFKNRFVTYINSRSRGTGTSIANAILTISPTLKFQILENANGIWPYIDGDPNSGNPREQFGFFTVYIDSGFQTVTDQGTVDAVSQAINAIRPLSVDYYVTVPAIVSVDIEYLLKYQPNYNQSLVQDLVKSKVINYVNTLGVAETLNAYRLGSLINDTEGVDDVEFLIIAGQGGNVGAGPGTIIKMGELTYA